MITTPSFLKIKAERLSFFSRFNKIITITYSVVILCACLLFGLLFKENYEAKISNLQMRLQEQSQALNYIIRLRTDSVYALKTQAQDYLKMTSHDKASLPLALSDSQEGTYYHLDQASDKNLVGNLVGQGSLNRLNQNQKQEIAMAYNLNPHFRAIKKNIETVTSIYYVSESGFENHFPWKPAKTFRWDQNRLKSHFLADLSSFHYFDGDLSWSDIYGKGAEGNLYMTCAAPIYYLDRFLGTVAMNVTLQAFRNYLMTLSNPYGRILLINNYETVIADTNGLSENTLIKAQEILPINLDLDAIHKLPQKKMSLLNKYWIFQVDSMFAPWTFIFYIPISQIVFSTLEEVGPGVLILVVLAALILIGSNTLIAQEFIKPAHKLVYFIATQGKEGKKGYNNIKTPWYAWFETMDRIFEENKSLIERLKLHIENLDHVVFERTKEISDKNEALIKAFDDLKKAQNQMIVQEKLAGLGALTAGIAHEIKNPLNYIINFAELSRDYGEEIIEFAEKGILTENQDQISEVLKNLVWNMHRIEDHGRRADGIIRNMLMHARKEETRCEIVDINKLVQENVLLAISGIGQQGFLPKIVNDLQINLPDLMIFKQELGRVILNIINNACYSLYQKRTSLGEEFEPEIHLKTHQKGKFVYIEIRDNGLGIPQEIRKKIFDPFFTTKPAGSGTGLGLSLSYEIITQQHHGQLTVDSKANHFTEFIIKLPLSL